MKFSIATSVKYGNYKKYLKTALRYQKLITRHFPSMLEHVGLSEEDVDDLLINLRPIRGKYTTGRYLHRGLHDMNNSIIEVDCRAKESTRYMMGVVVHELVHAKQYLNKVLHQDTEPCTGEWQFYFKGKPQKTPTTWNQYYNQPWEVEAREYQYEFTKHLNWLGTGRILKKS